MRETLAVFRKEAADSLRDRRSVMAALVTALVGPLIIGFVVKVVAGREAEVDHLRLAVSGAARAPSLARYLQQHGVTIEEAPADPEAAVRSGNPGMVLVVPEEYPSEFRAGVPASVRLLHDSSRSGDRAPLRRAVGLLQAYGAEVASARLTARGVSSDLIRPVAIDERDFATPQSKANVILGMLPLFLLLAAFVGGMNVAIDVTAGERERHSLEPLLATPVGRLSLAAGKWMAASAFALLAVAAAVAFSAAVLRVSGLQDLGIRLEVGARECGLLLAVLAPLALFAAAFQMLAATYSRTYREAQTYLSLLLFVPMIPGYLLSFEVLQPKGWMSSIPVLGHQILLGDALRGGAPGSLPALIALSAVVAIAASAVCVRAAGRLLASERIVLGR